MAKFFNSLEPSISHQQLFKRFWMHIYVWTWDGFALSQIHMYMNQWKKTQWCHWNRAINNALSFSSVCVYLVACSSFSLLNSIAHLWLFINPWLIMNIRVAGQPYVHCLSENWGYVLICSLCVCREWLLAVFFYMLCLATVSLLNILDFEFIWGNVH